MSTEEVVAVPVVEAPVEEVPATETQVEPEQVEEVQAEEPVVVEPTTVASLVAAFPELELPENDERTVVKEGSLDRKARFKTVTRQAYLLTDFLVLAAAGKKGASLKQVVDLSGASMVDVKGKFAFGLRAAGRNFTLVAASEEAKAEWVAAVSAQVEACKPVVEEVAVEEAPVEEVAVEEAPVEEVAVEESAAEEIVMEEVPVVELTEEQKQVAAVFEAVPALTLPENADRTLVKEGELERKAKFAMVPRKVYLFNDFLVLSKVGKKVELKQVIDLSTAKVATIKTKVQFPICLKDGKRNFVFKAADEESQKEWTELLTTLTKEASLKAQVAAGMTKNAGGDALLVAALESDADLLAKLAECAADASYKNEDGLTVLHMLALTGNVDMIKLMAEKGYSLDVEDEEGNSALHLVVARGERRLGSVCGALVGAGAETSNLVSFATQAGRVASVQALIAAGATLESASEEGKTALHYAVAVANDQMVKILLDAGANPNARDNESNTPLHLAAQAEVAQLLVAAGARVALVNAAGVVAGAAFPELATRKPAVTTSDSVIATKDQWVADSASKSCMQCAAPFTLFKRRHHCRRCGVLACADCCAQKVTLEGASAVRACNSCFNVCASKVVVEAPVEEVAVEEQVEEVVEEAAVEEVVEEAAVEEAAVEEVAVEEAAVEEVAVEEVAVEAEKEVAAEVLEVTKEKVTEVSADEEVVERTSRVAA